MAVRLQSNGNFQRLQATRHSQEKEKMIEIKIGNCLDKLKEIPDNTLQSTICSPPYWGLRDYKTGKWVGGDENCPHMRLSKVKDGNSNTGHLGMHTQGDVVGDAVYKSVCPLCGARRVDSQIGLEETPEEYINKLVEVFSEVHRATRDDGTLWINMGDTYCSKKMDGYKPKDLIGIPWMLAFALRKEGWYLRQDIIWHKPNPMPENVKDRCTKSHEYIFLLSKSRKYYYDHKAIEEEAVGERWGKNTPINMDNTKDLENQFNGLTRPRKMLYKTRNKRSVWTVTPKPFKGAHFATFPEKLIEPCILATTKKNDYILDPFSGAGTTGLVAGKHDRNTILIELNKQYAEMSRERLSGYIDSHLT